MGMVPTYQNLDRITEADLVSLLAIVREDRYIDYKRSLYDRSIIAKELSKDVAAFANADGGCIVLGMTETGGMPDSVCGVEVPNQDLLFRQMQQTIRSNVDPIPIVRFHSVAVGEGKSVILVGVPPSRSKPHAVKADRTLTFYKRTDGGTCEVMTVEEMRTAWNESVSVEERALTAHRAMLKNYPTAIGGYFVFLSVHPLPLTQERIDFGDPGRFQAASEVPPLDTRGILHRRRVFDGFLTKDAADDSEFRITRTGALLLRHWDKDPETTPLQQVSEISPDWLMGRTRRVLMALFAFYKTCDIASPAMAFLTLSSCSNRRLYLGRPARQSNAILESALEFPMVLFEDFADEPMSVMRTWADRLFQAGGEAHSPYYNQSNGEFNPESLRNL